MNMTKLIILIPQMDGLSHHQDLYTLFEFIGIGASLLESDIKRWANCSQKEIIS